MRYAQRQRERVCWGLVGRERTYLIGRNTCLLLERWIMRKMMTSSLMIVGLMLLGCTSKQIAYVNDPKQWEQQYSTNATSCETRAREVTGNATLSDEWYREVLQQCMEKKGWSHVPEGTVR